ncbi:MAG: LamG domain-containing protein [Verrucomicrobia bacterium]|nr:LamG domain-containing protein [Verrucomicrobiota bacterium]
MKQPTLETQLDRSQPSCRHRFPRFLPGACLTFLVALSLPAGAAPLCDLSFSEGGGFTTLNAGSLGGVGTVAQQNGFPIFVANVPAGPYTPAGNNSALDFGDIAAGDGGRAVDVPGALGALNGSTVCGWLNCRDLTAGWGGNRLVFALDNPNGRGFDLVHLADGSLRLGVNQWPDGADGGGPVSSVGKISADPNAGPDNWVYFAVTFSP